MAKGLLGGVEMDWEEVRQYFEVVSMDSGKTMKVKMKAVHHDKVFLRI